MKELIAPWVIIIGGIAHPHINAETKLYAAIRDLSSCSPGGRNHTSPPDGDERTPAP